MAVIGVGLCGHNDLNLLVSRGNCLRHAPVPEVDSKTIAAIRRWINNGRLVNANSCDRRQQ
jgi:hypothetical protein